MTQKELGNYYFFLKQIVFVEGSPAMQHKKNPAQLKS